MSEQTYGRFHVVAGLPGYHLLVDGSMHFGEVKTAYAEWMLKLMNRSEELFASKALLSEMYAVVLEQNNMLAQMIDSRERDQFTGKESDDSKRARQLLEQAGQIVQGAA